MFGPLFGKELLEMARRRRYFVVRVLIGVVLLFGWWGALQGRTPTVEFKNIASLSTIGEGLFRSWATWSLWGVVILAPMLVCGVIAAEKDGRTFEILLTTLLTNREILVGKAASRLLLLLILIASSVPILAVASLYGGFDVAQVAAAAAVIALTAFFVVVVSLYYSATTFKPYIALLRTYFFLVILWWLLPAISKSLDPWQVLSPWQFLTMTAPDESNVAPQVLLFRTRMLTAAGATVPTSPFATIRFEMIGVLSLAAGLHLLIGALLFWRTSRLLRARLQPGKPPWIFTATVRVYQALVSGARRSVERRKHSAGWSRLWTAEEASVRLWKRSLDRTIDRNPLLYRNLVANAFDPERFVAAIQILVGVGALAAFVILAWQEHLSGPVDQQFERVGLWALVGSASLLLACSAILGASAFARERQYGSWEVLTLADLSPWMHLVSSIKGLRIALRFLMLISIALAVLVGYVWSGLVPIVVWAVSIATLWLFVVVYALWTSLFHRRIASALAATVLGLATVFIASDATGRQGGGGLLPTFATASMIATIAVGVLVKRGRVTPVVFHIFGTVAVAMLVAVISVDTDGRSTQNFTRYDDYYAPRHANSAFALVAFPLSWGRRFAYGLTETIPDPRLTAAFGYAVVLISVVFLMTFRMLSAAEPGESHVRRSIRKVVRTTPHGVG